ncbi:Crp/Fnr family transcriptional regulator [Pseudomaricurvus alkylphenolicus]|uniref:Crp/Fnr family transcriptional regulator n=1 Tax=Pseudomaricurvus alkylphenolicus TaxID=1306991 RepID=UPI0014211281|nr:Crp/Fnr family transcriptional regulator [Pseudomaricurvus alkylphenolicus]NIB42815.1 Crp/Fnr family transcriptional regulator [Pseudomaricurvus alkylphenolicus]
MPNAALAPCLDVPQMQPELKNYPLKSTQQWLYGLREDLQQKVLDTMTTRQYKRQDQIYALHSQIVEIYTLIEGTVIITNTTESGKDVAITTLPHGSSFGDLSFVDQQPRQNFAIASTDCTVAVLNRRDYDALTREHPEITESMLQYFARRMRILINMHQDAHSLELRQQLARRLLFVSESQQQLQESALTISVSQEELAASLGVSRQHINKAVKQWQSEGLIDLGYRKIELLDLEGLKQVAADRDED